MVTLSTLDYYNVNADTYFEDTVRADVTSLYSHFEGLIKPGASILDLGCGSGRDSKHFLDAGFTVTAVDGSQELCKRAEMLLAVPVRNLLFQDLDYSEQFDAVWACASLLHVPRHDIQTVLKKVADAVVPEGIAYASFKYGSGERISNGRYFSDYTEKDIPWLSNLARELKPYEW